MIKQNKNADFEEQEIKEILGEEEREVKLAKAIKSLTISYFKKDIDKINRRYNLNKTIRRDIRGDYGVETILGYWIPKQIVDYLKKQQQQDIFEKFKKDLTGLKEKLDEVLRIVEKDWKKLKDAGKTNLSNPVENFKNNFNNIISDSKSLERIYYKYTITELPYVISQDIEIKELYKSLIQTCGCEKEEEYIKRNETMKAVCESHLTKELNKIINLKVE